MLYLGAVALVGSVLQVLPTVLPRFGFLLAVSWVGGILMPCAVATSAILCIRNSKEVFSISSAEAVRLTVTFFSALVVPLQVWSVTTLLPAVRPPRDFPQFNASMAIGRLLQLLFPMTVVLFVLLVTEWLWLPLVAKASSGLRRGASSCDRISYMEERGALSVGWKLLVGFSVLAGVFVSGFQWFCGYPMGDDARYYFVVLRRMDAEGFQVAFSTERPLFFLALYAVERILFLDTSLFLRLAPMALSVLLVVSTYYFARFVGQSGKSAALAALFAAVSPHVTVGVDYFIVANLLGISLMMLFLYSFWRSVAQRSIRWAVLTVALSGVTLGLHYFTWLFMILVLVVFFLLGLVEKRSSDQYDRRLGVLLISGAVAVVVPAILVVSLVGGGLLESLRLAEHMVRMFLAEATPVNFFAFLMNRERVYDYFAREHYAIPLLFGLALIGFVRLRRLGTSRERLVRSWFIASCVGLLIVRINEFWRFLYVIPLEVLAAFGLVAVLGFTGLNGSEKEGAERYRMSRIGFQLSVFALFGIMLGLSTLPSSILLLCPVTIGLVELLCPSKDRLSETMFLLVAFLALEQILRALSALA